jgi:hypothetical protein
MLCSGTKRVRHKSIINKLEPKKILFHVHNSTVITDVSAFNTHLRGMR